MKTKNNAKNIQKPPMLWAKPFEILVSLSMEEATARLEALHKKRDWLRWETTHVNDVVEENTERIFLVKLSFSRGNAFCFGKLEQTYKGTMVSGHIGVGSFIVLGIAIVTVIVGFFLIASILKQSLLSLVIAIFFGVVFFGTYSYSVHWQRQRMWDQLRAAFRGNIIEVTFLD